MSRRKYIKEVSYARVRELFDYRAETGEVTRKCDIIVFINGVKVASKGDNPGYLSNSGYYNVKIDGECYRLHRIIWLWYHGYFPENDIDHINRNKTDNRIENLREVSRSCNANNQKIRTTNRTGVLGVCKCIRKARNNRVTYLAQITDPYTGERCKKYSIDFVEAVAFRLAIEQSYGILFCNQKSSASIFMENYLNEVKDSF